MKLTLIKTVVAAACTILVVCSAQAANEPFTDAIISASYNGAASGMLGLDSAFQTGPGSNISRLDPTNTGVEFLSSDFLFGFDFAGNGHLTIMANGPVPDGGTYRASFDFGASLAAPIISFSLLSAGATSGVPVLTVLNSHEISIDLSQVSWNGDFSAMETAIALQAPAPVPEPSTAWMMLAGIGSLAWLRRRSRNPR